MPPVNYDCRYGCVLDGEPYCDFHDCPCSCHNDAYLMEGLEPPHEDEEEYER